MELSLFLGKVVGLYFIIFGAAYILRRDALMAAVDAYFGNGALVLLGAALSLIIGLLLVFSHNVWEMSWRVLITLVGYLSLLKGIVHLFAPEVSQGLAGKMKEGKGYLWAGGIVILIGLCLTYHGFFG